MAWLANLANIANRSWHTEEPLALCCPRSCNGTSFRSWQGMARFCPQTCRVLLPTSAVLQEVRARSGSATCTGAHGNLGGAGPAAEVQPASHESDRQGHRRAWYQSSHVHAEGLCSDRCVDATAAPPISRQLAGRRRRLSRGKDWFWMPRTRGNL